MRDRIRDYLMPLADFKPAVNPAYKVEDDEISLTYRNF